MSLGIREVLTEWLARVVVVPSPEDQWGPACFQVLAGLLVFALGIPPFVLQARVPKELHILAWQLIPRSLAVAYSLLLAGILLASLASIAPAKWALGPLPQILTVALLAASVALWGWFFLAIGSPQLIRRAAHVPKHSLRWLGLLSERAASMEDRCEIIRVAGEKVKVLAAQSGYQDGHLEPLASVIASTVEVGGDSSSPLLFKAAFAALSVPPSLPKKSIDRERLVQAQTRALRVLADVAARSNSPSLTAEIGPQLSVLRERNSDLLRLGKAFVESAPEIVAVPVLKQLKGAISPTNQRATPFLLGLCALVRQRGAGSREWAVKTLLAPEPLRLDTKPKLKAALTMALQDLLHNADLDAADAVAEWIAELQPKPRTSTAKIKKSKPVEPESPKS